MEIDVPDKSAVHEESWRAIYYLSKADYVITGFCLFDCLVARSFIDIHQIFIVGGV